VRPATNGLKAELNQAGLSSVLSAVSGWVCLTCYRHLLRRRVPPVCHVNYDPFQNLAEELQGVSAVENDLIALRLPFMKLRALDPSMRGGPQRFGQLCLHGMVIIVPTDLAYIQTSLPREFSADETVLINIKRMLKYKGWYESENVRPY
jgi:hypothetical protein